MLYLPHAPHTPVHQVLYLGEMFLTMPAGTHLTVLPTHKRETILFGGGIIMGRGCTVSGVPLLVW